MPAKIKVSSWLERNAEDDEADDQDDGSAEDSGSEEELESEDELQDKELSWEDRLQELRKVLVDRKELSKVAVLQDEWRITEDRE